MRVLVVFAALTACGDNITGLELDEYGAARKAAECERLTRCGLFSSLDACDRVLVAGLDPDMRAAVDARKVAYDELAAKTCLAAVARQSCDSTSAEARSPIPSCVAAFRGLVADGDSCAFDEECTSGSCDAPSCRVDQCCTGTCRSTIVNAPTDGSCHRDEDCADGFCGVDRTCHPRVAAREMCTRDAECDFDLACIGATELEPGRCRDLPPIAEACPYARCAEIGASCVEGVCRAFEVGNACQTATDCSRFGECSPDGRCAELPVLGESCTFTCASGAWCDAGLCVPPLEEGAPCIQDAQCGDRICRFGGAFEFCGFAPTCI